MRQVPPGHLASHRLASRRSRSILRRSTTGRATSPWPCSLSLSLPPSQLFQLGRSSFSVCVYAGREASSRQQDVLWVRTTGRQQQDGTCWAAKLFARMCVCALLTKQPRSIQTGLFFSSSSCPFSPNRGRYKSTACTLVRQSALSLPSC